jgi:Protein of unknown function (DUF3606)
MLDSQKKNKLPETIRMAEPGQLAYWSNVLRVTPGELQTAVRKVGDSLVAVKKQLGVRVRL